MILNDLIKLTLETLISQHRDRFDLSYSNDRDLEGLLCIGSSPADGRIVKNILTNWVFITFSDNQLVEREVILTGAGQSGHFATSPVVHYNREQSWVVTRNGSLYLLNGPVGEIPFDTSRVMFVAGLFNFWGIGQTLGMPPVFF
ncbi:hypothetical protein [Magnetovibrio blakemorei]|uniref:Uncharacterized protein n=1 Tax=Magnetovibrio blakemorei TaxID=28181 RepID=A0A1E5Q8A7_9PROT|nr:hypothetical protein [Magnetovibrio blakemorei]OEJ67381.1 hypothetical protein BEN30_09630 [Magnetovibrio blakemorei]